MRPRKTILCVEDNEQVLSVRKFMLETRGYRVLGVRSAAEALERLESAMPGSLDLLLVDLVLPGMDGNELVRRAKQIHPTLVARKRGPKKQMPSVAAMPVPAMG
jgi:two-component system response regulator CpxR